MRRQPLQPQRQPRRSAAGGRRDGCALPLLRGVAAPAPRPRPREAAPDGTDCRRRQSAAHRAARASPKAGVIAPEAPKASEAGRGGLTDVDAEARQAPQGAARSSGRHGQGRRTEVSFGDYGLHALEAVCWLTSRQIEAARRAMTHHVKRGGKIWIRVFPDKPCHQKPAETRMGSGKGAPDHWVAVVKPGRIMFEMAGVPEEIAREAMRLARHKLPIDTKFVSQGEPVRWTSREIRAPLRRRPRGAAAGRQAGALEDPLRPGDAPGEELQPPAGDAQADRAHPDRHDRARSTLPTTRPPRSGSSREGQTDGSEQSASASKVGRVISDKMDKTVVVSVERLRRHPIYKRIVRLSSKFKAHDEENTAKSATRCGSRRRRPLSQGQALARGRDRRARAASTRRWSTSMIQPGTGCGWPTTPARAS